MRVVSMGMLLILLGGLSVNVSADDIIEESVQVRAGDSAEKGQVMDEIEITAAALATSPSRIAQFASVINGDELKEKGASTLGETLGQELGVSNTSFGPSVGRPVIRGQTGDRVRVLQGGTGVLDVSSISPDHAISIEPLLAERIEIIRGPNTLAYGSGAIGGVVNVVDNRIPEKVPTNVRGGFEQRHESASDTDTSVFKLDGGKDNVAFHVDGFYRDGNETEVKGFASATPDGDESSGFIENSAHRAKGVTLGASWIEDENFVGFSVNRLENTYGVPGHAHGGDAVQIDLEQTRYELKGRKVDPLAGFAEAEAQITFNDYQHIELEGGATGTVFNNEAIEARLELTHLPFTFMSKEIEGVMGVQLLGRDFAAIGDEAFVPTSEIKSQGVFLVQSLQSGDLTHEWGVRLENQDIDPLAQAAVSHDVISLSYSSLWDLSDTTTLTMALSRSQRAPAVEELFANGYMWLLIPLKLAAAT